MLIRPQNVSETPEVKKAEKKIDAVLDDLEQETAGEVKDIDLEDVVDADETGRPVIQKGVDIEVEKRPERRGFVR